MGASPPNEYHKELQKACLEGVLLKKTSIIMKGINLVIPGQQLLKQNMILFQEIEC